MKSTAVTVEAFGSLHSRVVDREEWRCSRREEGMNEGRGGEEEEIDSGPGRSGAECVGVAGDCGYYLTVMRYQTILATGLAGCACSQVN